MLSKTFTIENEVGLHARPASLFTRTAAEFDCKIMVKNKTRDTSSVDAKSILSVMGLAVKQGHEIELTFDGDDEEAASAKMTELIESNFEEK